MIHVATDFSPWRRRRRWRSELGRSGQRQKTPQVKTCGYMNQTPNGGYFTSPNHP
ncbi:hypothetical protein [[Phormidium] sp. ETS-05]|uniref:hypothetical protein n=1 Tax=[Phormidium] sp. ETS-05 TaxID=222819 RepID=UPI0018EEF5E1|nr:hypothetical protein [[Phormidium] sp. ETS-05]